MIVEFDKSFSKSLLKIKDHNLLDRIKKVIISLEGADKLETLSNVKKLSGFRTYYRIKIGDYRLGFEKLDADQIRLIIVEHRKDIYKLFP